MKDLIYKEFKLAIHPTCYLFLLMGFMLLIPNYPYYVAFFYQTLGIFFIFVGGQANNDVYFTTLLPIPKRAAVKARFGIIVIIELAQIVVSIPFAVLRNSLNPAANQAGMEANAALFGLVFIMFAIFNLIFLTMFYKTAFKLGLPYVFACGAMAIFVGAAEAVIQLTPALKIALDTLDPSYLPQQLAVLIFGMVVFTLVTVLAYLRSAARFEKIDL
ncbi:ABC-2 transporter permease [Acetobacterium bakii]|uniref:ABC transporter n=1 Tax=Acetobacterium bakii TaxID=52689 RepID=A0A0L6TYE9_9FIRM|nr:ABC-2 transporter permease [Acetobacterium bakii]KNZ41273.1 hypothetical protein AKG39_13265 [Acetobacterium bakii]